MQKNNYLRKTLALVMAFLMIVTMMPVYVLAEASTPSQANAGSGGGANPTTIPSITTNGNNKLYEAEDSENTYYKYPNWSEESVSNQGLTKWELAPLQSLRSINNMSEPQEVGQLNYKGYHHNQNDDLILDLVYTWGARADSGVWDNVSLFVSPALNAKINWALSFYEDGYNKKKVNFVRGTSDNERRMAFSDMCQFPLTGNVHHTPIRLNLGKTSMLDLEKIDTTIQTRITNAGNTEIYAKFIGNTAGSNLLIDGYGSYTQSTSIPKQKSPNLQKNLLPFLRTSSLNDSDVTPNISGGQGNISYSPDDEKLFIASQWRKGPSSADVKFSGEAIGYRLAFAKELLDALEEKNGFVGYVEPSTSSGAQAANNKNNYITGIKKENINVDERAGVAYVIYAGPGFSAGTEKVVSTQGGTAGFLDGSGTLLTGQQYTLTTLNVDAEKLKKLYPNLQRSDGSTFKPEMMPLDTYSSIVVSNSTGMQYVDTKTTNDIKAAKGTEVKVVFDKSPAAGKSGNAWYDAARIALKLGELPIFGDLGVYASSAPGFLYKSGTFTYSGLSDKYRTYTTTLPVDFKLDKGSALKLYAGMGGDLINNSAKIYIGGKEIASFNNGEAKNSKAPRAVIGTESIASTLLERAQYMPAIKDTFDYDFSIKGFNLIKNQFVRLSYFANNNNNKKVNKEAFADENLAQGAAYKIGNITYPVAGNQNQKLYNYNIDIESGDKLAKDSPLIARTYNYQKAAGNQGSSSQAATPDAIIKTAVSSDLVIAKVQSTVSFDLNGGELKETAQNPVKSFEGYTDNVNRQFNYKIKRSSSTSPVIRILPLNKKFSTQKDYKPSGFEGDDVDLVDNTGFDLTGDALELRQFPTKKDDNGDYTGAVPEMKGLTFLGWTTKKLEGDVKYITEEFAKLKEATKPEDFNSDDAFIFTEKSPVNKSVRVYAAYGSPSIRIHSNFDTDENTEGMQETVHKQALDSDTVNALKIKDPSEVEVELESVIKKDGFTRDGFSLVGFSRDKDANEPDINVTGSGLTTDLYLRDGDKFKLASSGEQETKTETIKYDYKFNQQKGLDLYAVWKKDFTVTASKKWLDKAGQEMQAKPGYTTGLQFALIGRPAVGTFGYEVVVDGATYYPIVGTEKDFNPNGMKWENLKGYDQKGRRMSYIVVELKTQKQKDAFKNSSTTWSDYGLKIENMQMLPNGEVRNWGGKTQLLEFGDQDIDAFSAATVRKHVSTEHPEGLETHNAQNIKLGYFDTTGYIIEVTNTQWDLIPPSIDQAYEYDDEFKDDDVDNKVFVNPPKRMLNDIIITMPDKKVIHLIYKATQDPNKKYKQYIKDPTKTTSDADVIQNDKGQIVLSPKTALKEKEKFVAVGVIRAGGERKTKEAEMIVKKRLTSNKVTDIKQGKLTSNDEVPINFVVPEPTVTDKPIAGTVYTILIKDKDGTITPTKYTYTIPVDDAARIPGTTQTILVPKIELLGDKTIIIKAKEPNKKSVNSDEFTPDVVGPKVKNSTARDERWRRWTRLDLDFDEIPEGDITITYEENGTNKEETAPSKSVAKVIVEKLKLDPRVTNIKIQAADSFGNVEKDPSEVQYKSIGQTVIRIQKPLRNRNFVYVTTTEADTVVTITVYKAGTTLDSYEQDQYFNYRNIPDDKKELTITETFNSAGRKKISLGNYKFKSGDVVDIVGRIGTEGQVGFKITNPYTWIVK